MAARKQQKEPSFEEGIARLEEIVARLEQGDVPLQDSLSLFSEGTNLVNRCSELLENARQQVVVLQKSPEGPPVELPFDSEDTGPQSQ